MPLSKSLEDRACNFDPSHAIPLVEAIDNICERNNGELDLFMTIGPPLGADEHSLERLAQKLRNYLGFIKRQGRRDKNRIHRIVVFINADSDKHVIDYLQMYSNRASICNIKLIIKKINPQR